MLTKDDMMLNFIRSCQTYVGIAYALIYLLQKCRCSILWAGFFILREFLLINEHNYYNRFDAIFRQYSYNSTLFQIKDTASIAFYSYQTILDNMIFISLRLKLLHARTQFAGYVCIKNK